MEKKIVTWVIVILIILSGVLYFTIIKNELSSNEGIWSGIKIKLELTKNGETKTIGNDGNFPFSEDPILLVQSRGISDDGTSASFIVRTGEIGQTGGPWNDSEPFSIAEGDTYLYEPEGLTIKVVSIDISAMCPEGMQC